jgi:uncharacterized membrane protein YkvI
MTKETLKTNKRWDKYLLPLYILSLILPYLLVLHTTVEKELFEIAGRDLDWRMAVFTYGSLFVLYIVVHVGTLIYNFKRSPWKACISGAIIIFLLYLLTYSLFR